MITLFFELFIMDRSQLSYMISYPQE